MWVIGERNQVEKGWVVVWKEMRVRGPGWIRKKEQRVSGLPYILVAPMMWDIRYWGKMGPGTWTSPPTSGPHGDDQYALVPFSVILNKNLS